MCGIAGFVAPEGLQVDERGRLLRMQAALTHRGPDDEGTHIDHWAALGHRRLSIVDLAHGQQPLCNEDASIWIVFNGEIYNHGELRVVLEAAGHRYRTSSDTETIVHAYEEWGDDCVNHFRGMFAFAIWDAPRQRLLLARDRLGIKPLYWTRSAGRLLFGSEIKAILASGLRARSTPTRPPCRNCLAPATSRAPRPVPGNPSAAARPHARPSSGGTAQTRRYWDVPAASAACRET